MADHSISDERELTDELEQLDAERPGWDAQGRVAGARAALDMGMDRAFVSSIYGEELTARAEGQAKLPSEVGTAKEKTVLVLEDTEDLGRLVAAALARTAYGIAFARAGQMVRGLEMEGVALVVADCRHPDLRKLAALRTLRGQLTKHVRVLAVAGHGRERNQVLEAGADAFMTEDQFSPQGEALKVLTRLLA